MEAQRRLGTVIAPSGVGEVLDLGFNLARRNYRTLLIVGAVGIVPTQIVGTLSSAAVGVLGSPGAAVGLGILGTLVASLGVVVAQAAVMLGCSHLIVVSPGWTNTIGVGRLYQAAMGALPSLFLWTIVVGLLAIPLMILLPLGVFLAVRWSMSWVAILVERTGPIEALRRSWALTRGAWWHTFLVSLAMSIIIAVLTYSILGVLGGAAALSGFAAGNSLLTGVIISVGGMLINLVITPFSAGITMVLYYELRARTEGFDLEQRALQAAAGS